MPISSEMGMGGFILFRMPGGALSMDLGRRNSGSGDDAIMSAFAVVAGACLPLLLPLLLLDMDSSKIRIVLMGRALIGLLLDATCIRTMIGNDGCPRFDSVSPLAVFIVKL